MIYMNGRTQIFTVFHVVLRKCHVNDETTVNASVSVEVVHVE